MSVIPSDSLEALHSQLVRLRADALQTETRYLKANPNASLHPSARNLLHYLGVRQQDIRQLQWELQRQGLTSLSDIGAYTLSRLNGVIGLLERLLPVDTQTPAVPADETNGPERLRKHTENLLGPWHDQSKVHVMVTMPSQAAQGAVGAEPSLIESLLETGMSVMRINCAHDHPQAWQAMADQLALASAKLGKSCRIQADLAGPKLRTGPIHPSGQVLKFKPKRDLYGHVLEPHRIALVAHEAAPLPAGIQSQLVMDADFLAQIKAGDDIQFQDCRGQKRFMRVVANQDANPCPVVELFRTAYISNQTEFTLLREDKKIAKGFAVAIPDVVVPITLNKGDALILTRDATPGSHARWDHQGKTVLAPARIHCTLPEAFDHVVPGHRVWFDDGKIGGVVKRCHGGEMLVEITHAAPQGNKLREEKGINFPDTPLGIAALTEKDREDLEHVCQWADIVALSFVRCADDVQLLHDTLLQWDKPNLGVVLKIENQQAFKNLPGILLRAIELQRPFGVMIARGDLAVEVGFERLSEVQQEILWLCEAAHTPVVWATQILESMAKRGLPSRAEVSDAGMGVFAECAMLNKGPYILDTVRLLKGILMRMDGHFQKRRATLRKLTVAELDLPE